MKVRPGRIPTLTAAALLALASSIPSAQAAYPVPPRGTVRIGSFYALDPTCASMGQPTIGVVQAPAGGRIETRHVRDYPNFPTSNVRVRCDTRKVPVTEVLYRAAPGFHGADLVVFEVVFPRGQLRRYTARVRVQ